jgi:tetratricopeptide (TPR) repeat protein
LGDLLDQVASLHAAAVASIERYEPDAAEPLLDEAVALMARLPKAASANPRVQEQLTRLTLSRSWIAFEHGGREDAEAVLAEATERAEALRRTDLVALCRMQGASILGRSGDLVGALDLMGAAEDGLRLLSAADQARLLLNRGALASHLMRLDQARSDLERSVALAAAAGTASLEFMARHNQGYVEFLRGDLPAAIALMDAADAMQVEANRSVSQLDRARTLLEAGLVTEAAEALASAQELALAGGQGQELGEIELDLARTHLLLGEVETSAALAQAAERRFRDRAAGPWGRQAQLARLEADSHGRRDPGRTAQLAAALRQTAQDHGEGHVARRAALLEADALLDAALLPTQPSTAALTVASGRQSAQGSSGHASDRERARAAYQAARPLLASSSLPTRLQVRLVQARLALPEHPERASRALSIAADDLAEVQCRASSLDLRTAVAIHSGRLASLDLDLGVASGSVVSLFTRSERWRAVSDRVPFVRPPADDAAASLLTTLRRVRVDLHSATPQQQVALRAEATHLERRIRAVDWGRASQLAPSASRARPLPYSAALRAVRDRGVVLASFLPYGPDLYAVVLTPSGGRIKRLAPLAEVGRLVSRVRADVEAAALPSMGPLRAAVEASLRDGLGRLDRLLVEPLHADRLVVVPSLVVNSLPWGMLPSRRGRPTTVARTATGWVAAPGPAGGVPPRVSAIAGPDLAHADAEVRAVGQMWSGTVVSAEQSTTAHLTRALTESDLVHVAAHGSQHHQSPLFSTLRLGDGPTFAYELPTADIRASQVVLSACEVGRATIRPGDEALGLTAVLLSLGVRTVVAAASRVPDDLAAAAMTAYHRRLARGLDSAAALAGATADLPVAARAFTCFGADWAALPAS